MKRWLVVAETNCKYQLLSTPEETIKFLTRRKLHVQDREHFVVLSFDNRNGLLSYDVVSIGTLTASLVHPREVFLKAIVRKAAGVIIAHNHPSGSLIPSNEDREATKRLVRAGLLLGIPVLDHVILSRDGYFSFKQNGDL